MIDICFEDIEQNELINDSFLQSWFLSVIQKFNKVQGDITIVFCSDAYILEMNRSHLNHDYYTDIITFDYCEGDLVSGDLFISLDTVLSNSIELETSFIDEIHRVCVHGLLHLLGFKDKTEDDEREMRRQEDIMLSIR
ncbi:MAG: rRNA maturation RNase YbeY [Fluviicola sp.]|nr:rRNA maturation RNase YbeY [Fluviicola sp.]